MTPGPRNLFTLATLSLGLSGCAAWFQEAGTVLERSPTSKGYLPEAPARLHAAEHLPYAVLSNNVYERLHEAVPPKSTFDDLARSPCEAIQWPVYPPGWVRWWSFPDATLRARLHEANMHVEVWENHGDDPRVVVVFEGTVFSSADHWKANLRWFLRFLPKVDDQYTAASDDIAKAFQAELARSPKYRFDPQGSTLRLADGRPVRIITTGHSLGGGLAQQFAYAFPQAAEPPTGPRVSEVFAFDPSPVTGWYSTPDPPRAYNAQGLRINRIFEHGEILAYVRLFTSNLAPRTDNPRFWIYRYNFVKSGNVVGSHSMARLTCQLATAARQAAVPDAALAPPRSP